MGENLFGAALKGRKARWIGDLDNAVNAPTFIEDFARGLVTLGERDEALGEVWHMPTPEPTTGREFVRAIFEEAGNPLKVDALSSRVVKTLGLIWPLAREGAEMVYQLEGSFVVDGSKYRRTFGGGEATPYREGIRQTIDWYPQGSAKEKLPGNRTHKRQVPHQDYAGIDLVEEGRPQNVPPLQRKETQR